MRTLVSGSLAVFVSLGLLAPAQAEDPASFLDLRLAVAPYSRITNDLLQPLHLSLSFGFLGYGFIAFDVDHGEYGPDWDEVLGQTYRLLAGLRLRGPDWLDAAGDGPALESALALGWEHRPDGSDGPRARMTLTGLYWFWRGRLAAGVELGSEIGFGAGAHAALVAAVAFPWSAGASPEKRPLAAETAGPPRDLIDVRLRVSPPYCLWGMPTGIGVAGLSMDLTLFGHLVLRYELDRTYQMKTGASFAHTAMIGGRLRALDRRDADGSGLVLDASLLAGYARYVDEVYMYNPITMDAIALRQDWDLLYWFVRSFGAGLSFSIGYVFPVRYLHTLADPEDAETALRPYGGFSAGVVLATAF